MRTMPMGFSPNLTFILLRGGTSCNFPYYTNDGTPTNLTNDTQLYEGLGFPATATDSVGSSTPGNQTGDRTLSPGDEAVLPSSAGNSLQGATTTVSFEFISEDASNDP
jgi:hypothetical protein